MEVVEHDLLQVHLHLLHLSKNNSTLTFNLLLAKCGVGEDVTQDLNSAIQVTGEAFCIEDGLLSACVGIQVCPHVLNLELKSGLRSLGGAFEGHVLQEVCYAVVCGILIP